MLASEGTSMASDLQLAAPRHRSHAERPPAGTRGGVRGQTYLAAKRPADAAVEFQKIVSHRGLVMEDPVDAVARLQLARALVASGDSP
jgi:hypothetical protein